MAISNSKDGVCVEDSEQLPFCTGNLCSMFQNAFSSWLQTFVIKKSSANSQEWHFRTLFVAEISILPILLSFAFIFWWAINRNVKLRKTKGSSIPHMGKTEYNDENGSDNQDDEFDCDINSAGGIQDSHTSRRFHSPMRRRKKIQDMLRAYTVEIDDDEYDNETLESMESYLTEESDCEEAVPYSISPTSNIRKTKANNSASTTMFLSEERLNLWKAVKEIPIFSFLNEEAMEICMNNVEYVNLPNQGDFLWNEGKFDGSFFHVVKGRVRVDFLDFRAPSSNQRVCRKENDIAAVLHVEDTVVTSQLALIEGMVGDYLNQKSSSLSSFVGLALDKTTAKAVVDDTLLLRIPPSCFSLILDRFPETILRIIQTTLNRTQRVTVQILVRCCGLRQELLVPRNKEIKRNMLRHAPRHWDTLQDSFKKGMDISTIDFESISDEEKAKLVKDACATLASMLNIEELRTIEVLEEKCSLVSFYSNGDDAERTLIKAGSYHDSCYLLLQGVMEMGIYLPIRGSSSKELQHDASAWYFQRIETLSPGSILGEGALFTTDVSLFEIRCIPTQENCKDHAILLKIPRDVYAQLIVKHPQAMMNSLVSVLPALSPIVHFLTWTTEWIHVEAAGEIVQKGTPCNSLFVVLNGRLRAANRAKDHRRVVGTSSSEVIPPEEYGRGKIFGQVESLANVDWPFDVFAIRQSELAKVPIKTIETVVQNFPHTGLFLARVVASDVESLYFSKRKLLQDPKQIPSGSSTLPFHLPSYGLNLATIAVVPLSYNIDLKLFCSTLTQAMKSIAPCKLLTKSMVKRQLGKKVYQSRNTLRDLKITRLLADLEENNRVVIYQADHRFTSWTRLCVLQADCILLLVDSREVPETTRIEQTVAWAYEAMNVRIDLVIVGEEGKLAENKESNTDLNYTDEDDGCTSDQLNNWSESRKWIAGHHLVRTPFGRYRLDFQRMCRRISGRSVGLVLGAGGARGIAHLGVIRALIEAGVTVDMVGGTSQGAFCGALFARYPDDYARVFDDFKAMAADAASMKEKLFDLTLPMASMFSGRNFNRGIKRLLGKLRIQDLVLNFFCVSVDLQNQKAIIHTKGQLWKSVRASMGLTGYLPPVAENGSLLVDGGYLNSLPVDIMKFQMEARTVIAVDVSTECKRQYFEYGTHLSGWWVLWNSWNPFVKTVQVPSMGDISDMLIWVSSEQHRKAVKIFSDLHLTPPIQDVGTLEYDRFDEIVEKSYTYSKPIVDEWVRKNPWMISSCTTNV